ncbi:hypothetical protein Efla_007353 [Eimeria flavescens]
MPVDDDGDDLALEASPPPSPGHPGSEAAGGPAAAAAASAKLQQQRGEWYATQQRARQVPAVAVTPLFVSGGALHSTSTKNKEVILPPTLTRATDEAAGASQGQAAMPQGQQPQQQNAASSQQQSSGQELLGDGTMFLPDARICSRPVTDFSHLAVQKEGKTMSVICLPWLYHKLQKDVLLLGRGDHADIHTDHPSCSRAHCEIRRVTLPDGSCTYTLEDLHSAHGTLVNGGKIAPRKPTVLDDDDEVQVGFSQRLYTFKKGADRHGIQRSEPRVEPTTPQPPSEEAAADANAKPSFLQKHIERRARMGGFQRGRGGFFGGDRQRHQHAWAGGGREGSERGDGGYDGRGGDRDNSFGGSPHRRNSGREGYADSSYQNSDEYGGGAPMGGPLRRSRGGWQQTPYAAWGEQGGPSPHGAFTGANTTPLGPPAWRSPAPPYGSDLQGEAFPCYTRGDVYDSPSQGPPQPPYMGPDGAAGGPSPYQPVGHEESQYNGGPLGALDSAAGGPYGAPYGAPLVQQGAAETPEANQPATPSFAKADRVYARQLLLEHPEHFGDYAEELSDCASYTRRGEIGWLLSNGQLESGEQLFPPLMAAGALALNVGQLSSVLESHMGFHLFLRTA